MVRFAASRVPVTTTFLPSYFFADLASSRVIRIVCGRIFQHVPAIALGDFPRERFHLGLLLVRGLIVRLRLPRRRGILPAGGIVRQGCRGERKCGREKYGNSWSHTFCFHESPHDLDVTGTGKERQLARQM